MKIVMRTLSCNPRGTARPGTVLDLSKTEAENLISAGYAELYDAAKHKSNPRGLEEAAVTKEEPEGWVS